MVTVAPTFTRAPVVGEVIDTVVTADGDTLTIHAIDGTSHEFDTTVIHHG